ncbi:MAG: efflux RND transporter periplasmic adaptor subunit [Planctomycetota bacterium]|jgi:multidrug efflux pump subunit AcrA (membrane-fusion protein)
MPASNQQRASRRAGILITAILVIAILASTLIAFSFISSRSDSADTSATADHYTVATTSFDISVFASGELEARNQREIRSRLETSSTITEIVDEGIRVKQGDVLVRLNSDTILTQIQEEELRVESARSDLVSAQNSLDIQINQNDANTRQARLKLELAQIELNKWERGDLVKTRQELDLAIEKANRNLELYKEQYEKTLDLYNREFESRDKLKQDEIRYIEAEAEVKRAALTKEVYEQYEYVQTRKQLESDVEETEAELQRVNQENESQLASKQADLINKQRQLEIREEKLQRLRDQLEACTMLAPTDGLVVYATSLGNSRGRMSFSSEGPLQIGRNARPNELLIVLPDTSEMVAAVQVHEANAGRIQPGLPASLKLDAVPDRALTGKVLSVSVLAESGGWRDPNLREYTVKILLDPNEYADKLKPSLRADAEIFVGTVNNSLAVPMQAIFRDGPVSYVYAKQGDRYDRVPVAVGNRSTTHAQITRGIDEGTRVLLREPSPGEVNASEFDEETLLALGYSEENSNQKRSFATNVRDVTNQMPQDNAKPEGRPQSGQAQQGTQQRMSRQQAEKWMKDNAGKSIDDLELPQQMKDALKKRYPDGKIPEADAE